MQFNHNKKTFLNKHIKFIILINRKSVSFHKKKTIHSYDSQTFQLLLAQSAYGHAKSNLLLNRNCNTTENFHPTPTFFEFIVFFYIFQLR